MITSSCSVKTSKATHLVAQKLNDLETSKRQRILEGTQKQKPVKPVASCTFNDAESDDDCEVDDPSDADYQQFKRVKLPNASL